MKGNSVVDLSNIIWYKVFKRLTFYRGGNVVNSRETYLGITARNWDLVMSCAMDDFLKLRKYFILQIERSGARTEDGFELHAELADEINKASLIGYEPMGGFTVNYFPNEMEEGMWISAQMMMLKKSNPEAEEYWKNNHT